MAEEVTLYFEEIPAIEGEADGFQIVSENSAVGDGDGEDWGKTDDPDEIYDHNSSSKEEDPALLLRCSGCSFVKPKFQFSKSQVSTIFNI
jgi:hypothetical protein